MSEQKRPWPFQAIAILCCLSLGLAMIVNNQMGGEAMWFWYATTFHHGVKLYSDLHTALQPLFFLLTDGWMQMFGRRLAVTQIPSLLEIVVMSCGLLLVLRESEWPDWQKGIVLLGTFAFTVCGHSYRLDDYHVLAENLILYALLTQLVIARTEKIRRLLVLVAALGVLCGLAITTRLTDGAALLVSCMLCLPILARVRRLESVALLVAVAAVTMVGVVSLTGDSFSAYVSSSIFRAAGSKGGTGTIFAAPFLVLRNTLPFLWQQGKRAVLAALLLLALGAGMARAPWASRRVIFAAQIALVALMFVTGFPLGTGPLLYGLLISVVVLAMIPLLYVTVAVVWTRVGLEISRGHHPDLRAVLVLLPLAEWASYSAGAAAEPLTNYYAPMALLLLLLPVLQPFRRFARWADPSVLTLMAALAVSTFTSKALVPYSWQHYKLGPMFRDRVWFDHPVYGRMYIDPDLLKLSTTICSDIGARPGVHPDLLSLPYPFPNYFCDTPPWHNYVQTFFDTSTRATIEQLMQELTTAPPQWIVYQRQMDIMKGSEKLYNHGNPWPHRQLDALIAAKIADGEWTLVDQSAYLGNEQGSGWFIIRTKP